MFILYYISFFFFFHGEASVNADGGRRDGRVLAWLASPGSWALREAMSVFCFHDPLSFGLRFGSFHLSPQVGYYTSFRVDFVSSLVVSLCSFRCGLPPLRLAPYASDSIRFRASFLSVPDLSVDGAFPLRLFRASLRAGSCWGFAFGFTRFAPCARRVRYLDRWS